MVLSHRFFLGHSTSTSPTRNAMLWCRAGVVFWSLLCVCVFGVPRDKRTLKMTNFLPRHLVCMPPLPRCHALPGQFHPQGGDDSLESGEALGSPNFAGDALPALSRSAYYPPRPQVRQHLHQRRSRRYPHRRPGPVHVQHALREGVGAVVVLRVAVNPWN